MQTKMHQNPCDLDISPMTLIFNRLLEVVTELDVGQIYMTRPTKTFDPTRHTFLSEPVTRPEPCKFKPTLSNTVQLLSRSMFMHPRVSAVSCTKKYTKPRWPWPLTNDLEIRYVSSVCHRKKTQLKTILTPLSRARKSDSTWSRNVRTLVTKRASPACGTVVRHWPLTASQIIPSPHSHAWRHWSPW